MSADEAGTLAIDADALARQLGRLCPERRIDLTGALALPCPLPLADRFRSWVADGRHGGLGYMTRDPHKRLDPVADHPWAHSLLVFGQRYTAGWPAADPDPAAGGTPVAGGGSGQEVPWAVRVARYARGLDYHDVLLGGMRQVLAGLREAWPGLRCLASTDTGPFLEREYAWLAGLGFLGKNTCLIHERLGSGLFLGVALTNLHIGGLGEPGRPQDRPLFGCVPRRARPPARPPLSACGSCTRCIDACPTGALGTDGGLDAGRCLSTWTIEWRGRPPAGRAAEQDGILFGCDICQAVCPWNLRASARPELGLPDPAYAVLPEHAELDLGDLAGITDEEFRRRFRRTPLWRCHADGMRRNAATVAVNLRGRAAREQGP